MVARIARANHDDVVAARDRVGKLVRSVAANDLRAGLSRAGGEPCDESPAGVVDDDFGESRVADSSNNRIQKFSPNTTPVKQETWGALKSRYSE